MIEIITKELSEKMTVEEVKNWMIQNRWFHCVYILENGKQAYVGQTRDVAQRLKKHSKDEKKKIYKFQKVHIIVGADLDASVVQHYEALLIPLLSVDGKFQIVNDNVGYKENFYSRKETFELKFDLLWEELEKKELVKAKDIKMVFNSNTYKYFPQRNLNQEQIRAVKSILHVLDSGETLAPSTFYKNRPILINGDAGTGKTLVAVALFYYLRTHAPYREKEIAMVIAHRPMRHVLKQVFKCVKGLFVKDVISPTEVSRKHYDILICDEAHKLRRGKNLYNYGRAFKAANERLGLDSNADELDWLLKQSEYLILFYDKKQCVSPSNVDDNEVMRRLLAADRGIRSIELRSQMRVKAGRAYVPYIYKIMYQKKVSYKKFKNYEFRLFDSFSQMRERIMEKEKIYGLSRLCAGYAWKWISKEEKEIFDIVIEDEKIKWNSKTEGWLETEECSDEMGSMYTLHGVDLNYAGVVIGKELYLDPETGKIKVDRKSVYDNSIKIGTTDEELLEYVCNIYAVLLTRAIEGTYVYVCDENLKEYLGKYIEKA